MKRALSYFLHADPRLSAFNTQVRTTDDARPCAIAAGQIYTLDAAAL